jgi:hypothetical protein
MQTVDTDFMSELLSRAEFEKFASENATGTTFVEVAEDSAIATCGIGDENSDGIKFGNNFYRPDESKAYVLFELSHSMPVATAHFQCIHPQVIANSWQSILHQNFNLEHRLSIYDPENIQNDKILGAIVDAEFPKSPHTGWRVPKTREEAPGIKAVAVISKLARGAQNLIGGHLSHKTRYSVSMEISYPYSGSAFAVALNGAKPKFPTPDDIVACGFEYIPWSTAPEDLLACFSVKKRRVVGKFQGRPVLHMLGGTDGVLHYSGVGLTRSPAEREAKILRMAASAKDEEDPLNPLRSFIESIGG